MRTGSVKDYIRTIPDFPQAGIMFRDVTTLFADPRGFRMAVDQLLHPYAGEPIDKVVGLEARGFILGGAVAHQLSVGFVPIRKKGKLPGATIEQDYVLEYASATVELHDDAIAAGERVLVVDDLLATGGTAEAGIKLIERLCLRHRPARPGRSRQARGHGHGGARAVRIRGRLTKNGGPRGVAVDLCSVRMPCHGLIEIGGVPGPLCIQEYHELSVTGGSSSLPPPGLPFPSGGSSKRY